MITLGLDIGSNSVGSAWLDTKAREPEVSLGIGIFPAGVEQSDNKRGAPKNQHRRGRRSQRRSVLRRARRKRRLRAVLTEAGLLPRDGKELRKLMNRNPWRLRREGLRRELSPKEFGRVLVHLNQRRGAVGFDAEADDEGKVKGAIDHVRVEMLKRYADAGEQERLGALRDSKDEEIKKQFAPEFKAWLKRSPVTFGLMMGDLCDSRRREFKPIRNRRESFEFHADRDLICDEFRKLWERQMSFGGKLAGLLTDALRRQLDNPVEQKPWRHMGEIFGQRMTYWKEGTLGRCDLEPADLKCPLADMYAQEFRVLEFVNNLRIRTKKEGGDLIQPLNAEQRNDVLDLLRRPQPKKSKGKEVAKTSFSLDDVKRRLKIDKKTLTKKGWAEDSVDLTLGREEDADEDIKAVCDWFCRDIACGIFGERRWEGLSEGLRDSVNHAILKFDSESEGALNKLRQGSKEWWKLEDDAADRLVEAWKSRPKIDDRLNLSRKAIRNLLCVMRMPDPERLEEYPNQQRARQLLAHDPENELTPEQRIRYAPKLTADFKGMLFKLVGETEAKRLMRIRGMNKAARHYLRKHPDEFLPPAPMLANPVVRKAIHEVRRHLIAHLEAHVNHDTGEVVLPDRIVIELAREARQSAKVRNAIYSKNNARRKIREQIIKDYGLESWTRNQQRRAIERVLLCRQQRHICPYTNLSANDCADKAIKGDGECVHTGKVITERQAVFKEDCEIDHIVPYSRCGDDSMNNKVLCCIGANREKGNDTPKQWLGEDSSAFKALEQRMRHLNVPPKGAGGPSKQDYFTKKDYRRKWENLHRDPKSDEFRNSQLSDTAYAARQVGDYLRSALYEGESDGKQRVFFTKGNLTARLRNDWLLYRELPEVIVKGDSEAKQKDERNRQRSLKDRGDHRHHAIDAVVVALTPEYINPVAQEENYRELYHKRTGRRPMPKRMEVPKPWTSLAEFRHSVLSCLFDSFDGLNEVERTADGQEIGREFVVSHRPENRRIAGALHKDTAYGEAQEFPGLYTERMSAAKLKATQFVEPVPDGKGRWKIPGKGQGRAIRDPALREEIKACLKRCGTNPESFAEKDVKALTDPRDWKLRMRSGVPIKSITVLLAADPVPIKGPDGVTRHFVGGKNHHIEIYMDASGKWNGKPVSMFEAAKRNATRLKALRRAGVPTALRLRRLPKRERRQYRVTIGKINREHSVVDRSVRHDQQFVMSLAIGETVHMKHKDTKKPPGYFVVTEVGKNGVFFKPHYDARRAKAKGVEDPRDEFKVSPSQLQELGVEEDKPPYKVRVSPLGKPIPLQRD